MYEVQQMSVAEFAAYERILGSKIKEVKGEFLQQVRPFMFRPLCSYKSYAPGTLSVPVTALLGGFQHVVPDASQANSTLNILVFEKPREYTSSSLDYNRKRQIKLATRQFEIKPVLDLDEFRKAGYPAYLSFYERTKYAFGSERRDQAVFNRWAESIFAIPKLLILGGWQEGVLRGVSVSMMVEDVLRYATFFCDTQALKLYLPDLMLHTVREIASRTPGVSEVFVGMYKGLKGLDDFYLYRGCTVARRPALLRLNPLISPILQKACPRQYQHLLGSTPEQKDSD